MADNIINIAYNFIALAIFFLLACLIIITIKFIFNHIPEWVGGLIIMLFIFYIFASLFYAFTRPAVNYPTDFDFIDQHLSDQGTPH